MKKGSPLPGVKRGVVVLCEPDPRWGELFEEEARQLRNVLGQLAIDIQHVGSTAVPGLAAKPILDIAVGIRRIEDALLCRVPLETLGYDYAEGAGIEQNYVFGKGIDRTHLIHVVEYGGDIWQNYLRFRDALRIDPELRCRYEILKRGLAMKHPEARALYTEAKGEFIRSVVEDR